MASENNSVLIIAFDGLDKELIEEFNLEYIKQKEFGSIDNHTNIPEIKTPSLFASFITGKYPKEHRIGKDGFRTLNNDRLRNFENIINKIPLFKKFRGLRHAFYQETSFFKDAYSSIPTKQDLDHRTIFDEVENSGSLFVPSYDQVYDLDYITEFSKKTKIPPHKLWDRHFHPYRRKKLFRNVNTYYDLFFCHLHRVDLHQHYYGDPEIESKFNKKKLKKLYEETDELAEEIIEFFENEFETIIFMSDHGLPTKTEHNQNAFYSSNKELFREKEPHITDFYDKIAKIL